MDHTRRNNQVTMHRLEKQFDELIRAIEELPYAHEKLTNAQALVIQGKNELGDWVDSLIEGKGMGELVGHMVDMTKDIPQEVKFVEAPAPNPLVGTTVDFYPGVETTLPNGMKKAPAVVLQVFGYVVILHVMIPDNGMVEGFGNITGFTAYSIKHLNHTIPGQDFWDWQGSNH